MNNDLTGAVIAFIIGLAISFGNYKLSEYFLRHRPEKFPSVSIVRQFIQVAYILILFFAAGYTPWDRTFVLVGGALGVTIPMLLFTFRLLKTNKENTPENKEKEEPKDG